MRFIPIVAALSLCLLAAGANVASESVLSAGSATCATASPSDCLEVKFHNLNRYKGNYWSRVFRDSEVAPALKRLLKSDYSKLTVNMQRVVYPDSLSFVDGRGVLTLVGFVPQLFTISEAILIVEPCGNIYAAVLENGERFLYFSNDKGYAAKLPPAVEKWRAGIEKARSDNYKKPELPVVFKSR